MINMGPLRKQGRLSALTRFLRPVTNGTAIQRANTYTYRTEHYMIATAQAYHPGEFGDQHHIWTATLSEQVSLFTTHPAKPLMLGNGPGNSPGYWVGNGRLPHCVQQENVVLCMYDLEDDPGFLEEDVADFTHAYFPKQLLDEVQIDGRYAFARHRDALLAFVTRYPLAYADGSQEDLIQKGKDGYWVFEASTVDKEGDMPTFVKRIRQNTITCNEGTLQYATRGNRLRVTFGGEFLVNEQVVDTQYKRFESPYAVSPRKPKTITISHGGHLLHLDFQQRLRSSR